MAAKIPIARVGEIMKAVLAELQHLGGEARLRDLFESVEPKLNLTEYEQAIHDKSGYVRWRSIVHFYSIDCVKAGYIEKTNGRWRITTEGQKALKKPAAEFIRSAQELYRAWKQNRGPLKNESSDDDVVAPRDEDLNRLAKFESTVEQAQEAIEDHIKKLAWHDFQKLVAELLSAMGYHVAFIAPPGRDGGVDVVAVSVSRRPS